MNKTFNIIIAGVGGQGLVTLNNIIAQAALLEDFEVRTSELHGLSQRQGSVQTHLRFGDKVYSPLITAKKADLVFGLEITEGLRLVSFGNEKTTFVINDNYIFFEGSWQKSQVEEKLKELVKNLYLIPASEICKKELGKDVVAGIYLLGFAVLKKLIPLKEESMVKAIEKTIPQKFLELNINAFKLAKTKV